MNDVLGHVSHLQGYTGSRTTWANEMHYRLKHAPCAGLIARIVDLQSIVLQLCYGYPLKCKTKINAPAGNCLSSYTALIAIDFLMDDRPKGKGGYL